MKVILHDRNIVVRVVLGSDSDFDYHDERGEGVTVANNFSVSAGNYVDTTTDPVTVREATIQDYIDRHGAISTVPGAILKPIFTGFDLTNESEDSITSINAIPDGDVDFSDPDCFVHSLSDSLKRAVYNAFGFVDFETVKGINPQYLEITTSTTTSAPE